MKKASPFAALAVALVSGVIATSFTSGCGQNKDTANAPSAPDADLLDASAADPTEPAADDPQDPAVPSDDTTPDKPTDEQQATATDKGDSDSAPKAAADPPSAVVDSTKPATPGEAAATTEAPDVSDPAPELTPPAQTDRQPAASAAKSPDAPPVAADPTPPANDSAPAGNPTPPQPASAEAAAEKTDEGSKASEPAAEQDPAPQAPPAAVDKTANAEIKPGDWPQWAGTSYRNNVPVASNIPTSWNIGRFDRKTGEWIPEGAQNIKWVSRLGSQTYGNPVVADGRIYVGTNNSAGYLPRYPADVDLGVLLCFNEADGKFLWQHSSEKLPTGRVHDWPLQGICCAPYVEGKRLWFVTSRGTVVCADTEGYYDNEDDGPVTGESARLFDLASAAPPYAEAVAQLNAGQLTEALREQFAAAGFSLPAEVEIGTVTADKQWKLTATMNDSRREVRLAVEGPRLSAYKTVTPDDKEEADTIWVFDMMKELKVSQHNMCSCSITALRDILFVNTSNGVDESHINIPSPDAPSFIAMDKNTGEVYWTDKSPGLNVLHGQWSSPTVARLGGIDQVIFAGGDGWVYSFHADKGHGGKPDLLWKFDANPKTSKWELGGSGTRNNIIATPVVYDGLVYVAVGQDPEHGEGIGHLWCIDPNKRGDVSAELAVKEDDTSQIIPHRRIQAVFPNQGETVIPNPNSAALWHYHTYDMNGDNEIDFEEEMHRSCGTVAIKDDLLYIADFSGLFHCLDAKTGIPHWTYDMMGAAWGSPLIVEDHVYIGDEDGDLVIFELSSEPHEPIFEINMGNSVYSTPIVANGVLYISNKTHLFAIQAPATAATAASE